MADVMMATVGRPHAVTLALLLAAALAVGAAAAGGQPGGMRDGGQGRTLLQEAKPAKLSAKLSVTPSPSIAAPPKPPKPAAGPSINFAIQAINATGVAAALVNETAATIFVPVDRAFESLAARLNVSRTELLKNARARDVLKLHIVPGEALTAANITALGNATLPSLLPGYNLTITALPNGTVTVTVPDSGVYGTVVKPDVPFNRSIVHIIDTVLLPPINATGGWPDLSVPSVKR
ncbi:hypothetical protein TSOC_010780 [Tetrabaena socialis]|uniref:FAS1 domain-containing protein n=1 Tax=Tetrabaena socialis TaxID=47790 RepID=A0A2J7ZSF0_9CHLO|nr:hypothetical protein TSOC_010780 [Tetrabaena socialis]|eukprot:PNH03202.1 hypothetical protein TSOC_010780 [Tetrabaena socialis]